MSFSAEDCDIVVIGAGHAGIEAALAAVLWCIGIENLAECTATRRFYRILLMRYRCKIQNKHQLFFRRLSAAHKCYRACLRTFAVHPLKSHHIAVIIIQRIIFKIKFVHVFDERMDSLMWFLIQ